MSDAFALVSTNLEKLLGLSLPDADIVAYHGGDVFDFNSKVVGVISSSKGTVELWE